MDRPPRRPDESFLPGWSMPLILVPSVLLALATLGAFWVALWRDPADLAAAQSASFATLALAHLGIAWALRSTSAPAVRLSPRTNPMLLTSTVVGALLVLVLVYTAPGQALFHTHPLDAFAWAVTLMLTPLPFLGAEVTKAFLRRRR